MDYSSMKIILEGEKEFQASMERIAKDLEKALTLAVKSSEIDKKFKEVTEELRKTFDIDKNVEKFKQSFGEVKKTVVDILNMDVSEVAKNIGSTLSEAGKSIGGTLSEAKKTVVDICKMDVSEVAKNIGGAFSEVGKNIGGALSEAGERVKITAGFMKEELAIGAKTAVVGLYELVTGVKKTGDQTRETGESTRNLGQETKSAAAELNANNTSLSANAEKYKSLGKEIESTAREYIKVREEYGRNSAEAKALEARLGDLASEHNNAGKAADEEDKQIAKITDSLDLYERNTKSASNETGIFEIAFDGLGKAFKKIGQAIIEGTKALAGMSKETAAYISNLSPLAEKSGASAEDIQKLAYAADKVNISMDSLTDTMSGNNQAMNEAMNGNTDMMAAYEKLGVSITGVGGALRSSGDVYIDAIDALGNISDVAERDAIAMQIFGQSAQDIGAFIDKGKEGILEFTDEAEKMGMVLSEGAFMDASQFSDTSEKLDLVGKSAKNALGTILMPSLNTLGSKGVDLLGNFAKGLNEARGDGQSIGLAITNSLNELADTLPDMLEEITNQVLPLVSGIVTSIAESIDSEKLSEAAKKIIEILVTTLTGDDLKGIIDSAASIISSLAEAISETLPTMIPAIVDIITFLVKTLLENMPLLLGAALDLVIGLAKGLLDAIPELIKALPEIIDALLAFLLGAIPQIIEAGITLLISLVDALPEIIDTIVEVLPQIIDGILDAILDNLPQIIDAGLGLFAALIENLPKIIETLKEAVPKIILGLAEKFDEYVEKMKSIGGDLLRGIWDGIKMLGAWFWDQIKELFGGIVSGILGIFGIKSPSTIMRDLVGKNMVLGLADGIEENSGEAISAAENLADGTLAAVSGLGEELTSVPDFSEQSSAIEDQGEMLLEKMSRGISAGEKYITNALKGILLSIQELFRKNENLFSSIGENIMTGIGYGIISRSEWLMKLVMDFLNDLKARANENMEIHSPSKVFAGIGENMAKGLGIGFTDTMNKVRYDISNAIPIPQLPSSPGGWDGQNNNSNNVYGGNVINSTLNFYTQTVTPSELAKASRRASEQMLRYAT